MCALRGVTSFASFVRFILSVAWLPICQSARPLVCAFLFASNFATSIYIHISWSLAKANEQTIHMYVCACVRLCVSATQKTKLNAKIIIKQAYHEFSNCAVNYDYNLL